MFDFFYNFQNRPLADGLYSESNLNISLIPPPLPIQLHAIAWYDAADPAGTGILPPAGHLPTWADKSLNSHTANIITTDIPSLFTDIQNGLPGISFQGDVGDINATYSCANTNNSTFGLQNGFTFIGVILSDNIDIRRVFCRSPTGAGPVSGYGGGTGNSGSFRFTTYNVKDYQTNDSLVSGDAQLLTIKFDPTSINAVSFYLNGNFLLTQTNVAGPIDSPTSLLLGSGNGIQFWQGYLFELIFFNYVLSNTQISQLTNYLNAKWNIF